MANSQIESIRGSRSKRGIAPFAVFMMLAMAAVLYFGWHAYQLQERFLSFAWDGVSIGQYSHRLWLLSQGTFPDGGLSEWLEIPLAFYPLALMYHVWTSPLYLTLFQTAALTVSAVQLFYLGRRYVNTFESFIVAVLYCIFPPIAMMNATSFDPAILTTPFTMAAILSVMARNNKGVLLSMALACCFSLKAVWVALPLVIYMAVRAKSARGLIWLAPIFLLCLLTLFVERLDQPMGAGVFYGALFAPYLFWVLLRISARAESRLKKISGLMGALAPAMIALLCFVSILITPALIEAHPGVAHVPLRKSSMENMLLSIPEDASIETSPAFYPRLFDRSAVHMISRQGSGGDKPEFVLADLGVHPQAGSKDNADAPTVKKYLAQGYVIREMAGNVALLSQSGESAIEPVRMVDLKNDRPYMVLGAAAGRDLELTGFTMRGDESNPDLIHFYFYWTKQLSGELRQKVVMQIVDEKGKVAHETARRIGWGLADDKDWTAGKTLKEHLLYMVPDRLRKSQYEVRMRLLDGQNYPLAMSASLEGAVDEDGRLRLIGLDAV